MAARVFGARGISFFVFRKLDPLVVIGLRSRRPTNENEAIKKHSRVGNCSKGTWANEPMGPHNLHAQRSIKKKTVMPVT